MKEHTYIKPINFKGVMVIKTRKGKKGMTELAENVRKDLRRKNISVSYRTPKGKERDVI